MATSQNASTKGKEKMREYRDTRGNVTGSSKGCQGGCASCLVVILGLLLLVLAIAGIVSALHGGN